MFMMAFGKSVIEHIGIDIGANVKNVENKTPETDFMGIMIRN